MCVKKIVARAKRYKFFQANIWGRIFVMRPFRGKKVIYARLNRRYVTRIIRVNAIKMRRRALSIGGSFIKSSLKVKTFYFGITPYQLKAYVRKARKLPFYKLPQLFMDKEQPIRAADNLGSILELRLDNVLLRTGLLSPQHFRQLLSHKKIMVNNKIVTKSSSMLVPGDKVSFSSKILQKKIMFRLLKLLRKRFKLRARGAMFRQFMSINNLSYLSMSIKSLSIIVGRAPKLNKSIYYPFRLDLKQVLLNYSNI